MAAPASIVEFVDLLNRSNVLEKRSIDDYLNDLSGKEDAPASPKQLAQAMVRDGVLTNLQAGLILKGKWRNFVISGKYKLMEHLGTGGMGSVYLCEHVSMRRRVAVKVLPSDRVTDPIVLERFHREARAVAALDHRNIVRAHDMDRDNDLHFLVLEYVDGSSLQWVIEKFGPLALHRAVNYIRQAADGLQHAHEAGLIHRDIKPANLLLDRSGLVKILDLGLARFFADRGDITKQHDVHAVLGTADYLAPEQALDSSVVDIRGDIYSLGVTLYYLLAGRTPYKDGSLSQKLVWHQISQPTPIQEHRKDVPKELWNVIEKMLAKDPANRYQTPAEVVEALESWDRGSSPPPEQEMPQLSAAASGGSTSRLPAMHRSTIVIQKKQPKTPAGPAKWYTHRYVQIGNGAGAVFAAALCGAVAMLWTR
jgi:serine/threonine protein kinase